MSQKIEISVNVMKLVCDNLIIYDVFIKNMLHYYKHKTTLKTAKQTIAVLEEKLVRN